MMNFWDIFLNGKWIGTELDRDPKDIKRRWLRKCGYDPTVEVRRVKPWWEEMEWGGSGI